MEEPQVTEREIPASYKDFKVKHSPRDPAESASAETAAAPKPRSEPPAPPAKPEGETTDATGTSEQHSSAPPAKQEGKTHETPDDSSTESQEEKERRKRDRSAEGKIKELTLAQSREKEAREAAEAKLRKSEEELETLRKASAARTAEPAKIDPPPPVKTDPPAAASDPKPSLKQILQKADQGVAPYAGHEYEELVEIYNDERDAWRDREQVRKDDTRKREADAATAEQQRQQSAKREEDRNKVFMGSVDAARTKYTDFQQQLDEASRNHPHGNHGIGRGVSLARNPGEVMYALAKDGGAEYGRIAKLPEDEAMQEVLYLEYRLSQPAPAQQQAPPVAAPPVPERTSRPAVSRAPAPYRPINGMEDGAPARLNSYADAKKTWTKTARTPA